MSVTSKPSAERTTRLSYLQAKEIDHVEFIVNSEGSIKQHSVDWETETWERIDLKDNTLLLNGVQITDKKDTSQYIKQKLRQRGCDEGYVDTITRFLKPESIRDWNLGEAFRNSKPTHVGFENLNPVPLEQLKEQDNEQLRDFISTSKANLDHALFEATNRGLAVVDHDERDPKISNYKPDPMDTDFSISLIDLASRVYTFGDIVAKLAKKVRMYPIHDMNINKQRALETNRLAQMFHGLEQKYLPSLTDDKYAFSEQMWYDVLVKHEQYSKHGAAVKSKVQAVDEKGNYIDEWRPLTREVVTDNLEETVEDLKRVQTSNVLMAAIQGWVDWHDVDGKVINYIASRRIRVHPKLSETAFGAD